MTDLSNLGDKAKLVGQMWLEQSKGALKILNKQHLIPDAERKEAPMVQISITSLNH